MRRLSRVRIISDLEKSMLLELKDIMARYDPEAEVVLYGSAARGQRQPDSDYDLLVITSRKLPSQEERDLDRAIYGLQLERGVVLSVMIHANEQWENPLLRASPYRKNVLKEGIIL